MKWRLLKLGILETILIIIYVIISVALIVLALIQSKEDDGASGAIVGAGASSSFYEKNKGRTAEGKMKRWTIILMVCFVIVTIGLGIVYMIPSL